MRILVIASELPPVTSGVASSVDRLVRGLRQRGHEVDTLSSADAPYLVSGEVRLSGLGGTLLRRSRKIARHYDLVNVHGPAPTISDVALLLLRASQRNGKPRILYTHHSMVEFDDGLFARLDDVYDAAHRRVARLADHVVVTSEAYADLYTDEHDPPVSVVPWGVDFERFQPAECTNYDGGGPLRVLLVGQLRPYKGAKVAMDAVTHQPRLALTVVGRGPQEALLRRQLDETRPDNVRMTGYLDEPALLDAYRSHDVCVLPSTNRLEAFGLSLLEGMAAGCAPVASDLPGVRDLVRSNGLLVAPGDPQDLRWALHALASRPDVVRRFQRGAIETAARHSWESAYDAYDELAERLARA